MVEEIHDSSNRTKESTITDSGATSEESGFSQNSQIIPQSEVKAVATRRMRLNLYTWYCKEHRAIHFSAVFI
jgi:hypothetical protein